MLAGEQAERKFANVVAAGLLERALVAAEELTDLADVERARVAELLGDVCERFGAYERAEDAYGRAAELLREDRLAQARLMMKLGMLSEREGQYEEAVERLERGLAQLDTLDGGQPALEARGKLELWYAGVRYRQARYDESIEWSERAVENAESAGDQRDSGTRLLLPRRGALGSRPDGGCPLPRARAADLPGARRPSRPERRAEQPRRPRPVRGAVGRGARTLPREPRGEAARG